MKVITISINKREKKVPGVQAILTKYGEEIYSRIGYHNIEEDRNLIVIVYTGEHAEDFCEELKKEENVIVNCIEA